LRAFADERRIVAATRGRVRTRSARPAPLGARLRPHYALRSSGRQTRQCFRPSIVVPNGGRGKRVTVAGGRRPRLSRSVAATRRGFPPVDPVREAGTQDSAVPCPHPAVGHRRRARPCSRGSPRALRCGTSARATVREAWSRTDYCHLRTGALIATPRCGAPAGERRVVAGDAGGRERTRNAHPVRSGSTAPSGAVPTFRHSSGLHKSRGSRSKTVRVPGRVVRRGRRRGR
jgi:hypothetical protein